MRVVDDQIGSPTPARWLAVSALQVLVRSAASGNSGLWHVAGGGECSWYDFAKAIYEDGLAAGVIVRAPRLAAVPSDAYPTRARRPRYSRLDCSRIREDFGIELPDWRIGLRQVLAELA
jgi:dTDP-4-dehydrorhamnose reductase